MNIPSELHSIFLSSNSVNHVVDAGSVTGCNPLLSTQPLQYPPNYSIQNGQKSNLVDSCNFGSPAGHQDLSAHPSLMPPIPNSSLPVDGASSNKLTRAGPTEKSWNHKMVEKQRRKDMKTLFSRLRSLLPEEYIRGKRAVSDHVLEAANYICYLQQKIEDLSTEREKLKTNFDKKAKVAFQCAQPQPPGSVEELPAVIIKCVGSGVKVCINAFKDQIVYSDVLVALEECGLDAVNVASSAINMRVFHTIHAKPVSDVNDFNIEALSMKFRDLLTAHHIEADLPSVENYRIL